MKKTLIDVASWGYQLQNIDPAALTKLGCDLLVMDPKLGDDLMISPEQMANFKSSDKTMVAYLSIGEAEDYRPYWRSEWVHHHPVWLGAENPEWKGNYTVKFWHREWRDIVVSVLKQYKKLGFDGVYLDKVDIVDEFSDHDPAARGEMRAFIAELRQTTGPEFLIIQQNAPEMLELTRDLVDAVAVEDLFYGENGDGVENSAESIANKVKMLHEFGKPVFGVEYGSKVDKAIVSVVMRTNGWVPLFAERALDRLPKPDLPISSQVWV